MQGKQQQDFVQASYTRTLFLSAIRAELSAAGFSEKEHNAHIQAALNITYSAAYRKLSGVVGWTDVDIAAIADYLGRPVDRLIARIAGANVGNEKTLARININGVLHQCSVEVGEPVRPGKYSEFVLVELASQEKQVVNYADANDLNGAFHVIGFTVNSTLERPLSIAILEDDELALGLACEILRQHRLNPIPFKSADELRKAIENQKFDEIVVDWWVNNESAENIIKEIRGSALNKDCNLTIVTGQLVEGGKADEKSLGAVISKYKVKTHIKPIHWPLLAAEWVSN